MDNFNMNARRDVTGVDDGLRAFFRQTYSFMGIAIIVTAITGFIVQNFFLTQVYSLIAGNIIGTFCTVWGTNFNHDDDWTSNVQKSS